MKVYYTLQTLCIMKSIVMVGRIECGSGKVLALLKMILMSLELCCLLRGKYEFREVVLW